MNWRKSEVFFLNVQPRLQGDLVRILGLKNANFLGRFLGMPLFTGINKVSYWESLLNNCRKRLGGWKGKWLTSVGRLMMLKMVLSTILIYFMACLKLPASIEDSIVQLMRRFFWSGTGESQKFPLMAWEKICKPFGARGAGVKQLHLMNMAMGVKLVWAMYQNGYQRWVQIMCKKYLDSAKDTRIFTIQNPPKGSAIWNFVLECRSIITKHITWELNNGRRVAFWEDSWEAHPTLKTLPDLDEI